MLQKLTIQNFALIENLEVDFASGLSTITGETGAGKSLLLGALGMVLGNRADASIMKDSEKKCVIEGVFEISAYDLESIFEEEDFDYEIETVIRRELLPSGKSRAFVNDSPVRLTSLQNLGKHLIDIHSQHQTLELTEKKYQFYILDSLAGIDRELSSYKRGVIQLKEAELVLKDIQNSQQQFQEAYQYNKHLYEELEEADVKSDEQEGLEELLEKLNNTEEIQERLGLAISGITTENFGAYDQLNEARIQLQKIASISEDYKTIYGRVESVCIELDDLRGAIELQSELVESDPEKLTKTNDRLQLLYTLQKKHSVSDNDGLLEVFAMLEEKVTATENMEASIINAKQKVVEIEKKLNVLCDTIFKKREKVVKKVAKGLEKIIAQLGMQHATFLPELTRVPEFNSFAGCNFELLFSANKGGNHGSLKKVASGGELSRIMLAVKLLLAEYIKLPTIIFDEIDTGVSGEVAQQMANLLQEMGRKQQVFSITHLPQIAAKGKSQYKVFKQNIKKTTVTQLKLLNTEQRIAEIAEMIGGKQLTDAAKNHAQLLLDQSAN